MKEEKPVRNLSVDEGRRGGLARHGLSFFRQSGWMMVSAIVGGGFMWAVHPILQKPVDQVELGAVTEFLKRFVQESISKDQYGLFCTFLNLLGLIGIPAIGLQTIFAQQAASAISEPLERQLRTTIRTVLAVIFLIWLVLLLGSLFVQDAVIRVLGIGDAAALWIMLVAGLFVLWMPVLLGLLQGRQNFLWFGWASILSGLGRCLAIAVTVRVLGNRSTGTMLGVLFGAGVNFVICLFQAFPLLRGPGAPVPWRRWLGRVAPLTFGLGAMAFMVNADVVVVRSLLPKDQSGLYGAARIIGNALIFFTIPLATVMFPKVVQSAARAERTDVVALALGTTALLGGAAALVCTLFPGLPLWLMYDRSYFVIKPLVPWLAWCILPLTLSNVLTNNLLARERYRAVPWMVLVALGYGATLLGLSHRILQADALGGFKMVAWILGAYSLFLLGVSAWFTWRKA